MPNLRSIHEEDFASCIDFLAEREYRCITLMSHLVQNGQPSFPERKVRALVQFSETPMSPIDGVILVTNNGILLHCIREDSEISRYVSVISRFIARTPIRCIIGDRDHTLFLESFLSGKPSRVVDYRLMTFSPEPGDMSKEPSLPIPEGIEIVRCTQDDTERLLPLQESYEREEVAPPGDPVDRESTRINLHTNLGKQRIFMALREKEIVAKAGTNALGLAWIQLGGVYTVPEWRGKGLATRLVRFIAETESTAGNKIALFVKLSNEPAKKVYARSGFKPDRFFRISYW